jgi:hypothetical protein
MTTFKQDTEETPVEAMRALLISIKSGLTPLAEMNDDYKERRLADMHDRVGRALDLLDSPRGLETRDFLLRLIETAPDPTGIKIPDYARTWDASRSHLRSTCPNHVANESGTCPNCHGDTAK